MSTCFVNFRCFSLWSKVRLFLASWMGKYRFNDATLWIKPVQTQQSRTCLNTSQTSSYFHLILSFPSQIVVSVILIFSKRIAFQKTSDCISNETQEWFCVLPFNETPSHTFSLLKIIVYWSHIKYNREKNCWQFIKECTGMFITTALHT